MQEFDLIRLLHARLRATRADTRLGTGDDAAVIAPPLGHDVVVSSDTLIAGRHFPEDTAPADIGFKSLAVSLSDVAAMGAVPAWATLALSAPQLQPAWCEAFVDGIVQATAPACVDIVGGDTTRGPLSLTSTVFGLVSSGQAVRRDGAQPGDVVCVTGTLGDAALGLKLWFEGQRTGTHAAWLCRRLHRPQWRQGTLLPGVAHAAIDLSDGLLADLGHILAASNCGARIDADALPASVAFHALCPTAERRRLQLAGGDDYEQCIIVPQVAYATLAARADCAVTPIGVIQAQAGMRVVDADGVALAAADYPGWDHFR